jgi:protein involved in plasmid replication-relaxation
MSRLSQAQLVRLADELSPRRWLLLGAVSELRLVTGGQLRRRFYPSGASAARVARLDLAALHELRILHRLERRIGGLHAGSSGFVYALDSVGRRLLELRRGEGLPRGGGHYEPSVGFVDHALAVSEVWVGLHEYLRDPLTAERDVEMDFRVERAAWRSYLDLYGLPTTLKPDAELQLRRAGFTDWVWLEIDCATERRSTIRRKLDAYVAYYRTGVEQRQSGMFPLTVWLTTTHTRAGVLTDVIGELPRSDQRLFRVGLLSAASPFLLSHGRSQP